MKPGDRVLVSAVGGGYEATVLSDEGLDLMVRNAKGRKRLVARKRCRPLDPPQQTRVPLERPAVYDAPAGVPVPKDPPGRSEPYLAFVREHACCSCGAAGPSDPHHYAPKGQGGGMGMKCSDMRTVPLCRLCHDHFHSKGYVPGRFMARETHLLFMETQVSLLVEWIERKEER